MNAKQKKFILEKLCPFILREQGRGFEMKWWHKKFDLYEEVNLAIGDYPAPNCGTVCCIGGSVLHLKKKIAPNYSSKFINDGHDFYSTGELIGLNALQSVKLFSENIRWPTKFKDRYHQAKTPLQRAQAAVALLKEVVKTEGKCLGE